MALTPQAREGLDAVREQLYRECRTRDEAVALVDAALRDAGMEGYKIENGSLSVPNDRVDEIERHIEDGCWVPQRQDGPPTERACSGLLGRESLNSDWNGAPLAIGRETPRGLRPRCAD